MGVAPVYFLDTYAMIELLRDNPTYTKFNGKQKVTSVLHLLELRWILTRLGMSRIDHAIDSYFNKTIPIGPIALKHATSFRLQHKQKNLSYADCLGYAMARMQKMIFLTGDRAFVGMDGTEVVR